MIVLCIDEEVSSLQILIQAIEKSPYVSDKAVFTDEFEALRWAECNCADIAFLSFTLHTANGFEIARKLISANPEISIVFCAEDEKNAVEAINMHIDAGFLIKPVNDEIILAEINRIKKGKEEDPRLKVRCFGNFEVFVDKKPLQFKRKKSKELLAYLVDRRGAFINSNEICSVLWEEEAFDTKVRDYLYHLISDIKHTLLEAGVDDVLITGTRGYATDSSLIDCDYYHLLHANPKYVSRYAGEYMQQYSWCETTAAWLHSKFTP